MCSFSVLSSYPSVGWPGGINHRKFIVSVASHAAVEKCCHVFCSLNIVKLLTCIFFFNLPFFSKQSASLDFLLLDNSLWRRLAGSTALFLLVLSWFLCLFMSFFNHPFLSALLGGFYASVPTSHHHLQEDLVGISSNVAQMST